MSQNDFTFDHVRGDDPSVLIRTIELLDRVKIGDRRALDALCSRVLPKLRRWATGRLPRSSRSVIDTDDLVQDSLIGALANLAHFEYRHDGALDHYLRGAVKNRIRDEIRRVRRSPVAVELTEAERAPDGSPLDIAIGRETAEKYEAALARLKPEERQAVVARVEMNRSYKQVADVLGKPSTDAARMTVTRALVRLAREMASDQ